MTCFFSFLSFPDLLVTLMNTVRTRDMHHWVLVLPLFHLLRGVSKPFEAAPLSPNPKLEPSWAGLQGLRTLRTAYLRDRKSVV